MIIAVDFSTLAVAKKKPENKYINK